MSSTTSVPPGQPQLKAAPVAQLVVSVDSVSKSNTRTPESAHTKSTRPRKDGTAPHFASDQATISLIRRVLIPHQQTNGTSTTDTSFLASDLPPLTSSNAVDLQLYAILAVVIKDFVNTWYTKITPDHGFVEEVVQIVAHCSRAIEQRIRKTDMVSLLLDELPSLITDHVQVHRLAKQKMENSPFNLSYYHIYHGLMPHPAFYPVPPDLEEEQHENERAYRQLLIQGTLAVLLPTEDLQNSPLRILVGDILADLILGQALSDKICQGWFLHETICRILLLVDDSLRPKVSGDELHENVVDRLEKFGLLQAEVDSQDHHLSKANQSWIVVWFWRVMQYAYLLYLFVRQFVREVRRVRKTPPRAFSPPSTSTAAQNPSNRAGGRQAVPVLAFSAYTTASTLLNLGDRMPWLVSTLTLLQYLFISGFGQIATANSILDRILYNSIQRHFLQPSLIPQLLLQLRVALFPNNSVGPPAPPPPSSEEQRQIKRRAAKAILGLIPDLVTHWYYRAVDEDMLLREVERDILEPFEDVYINKHLIYSMLEVILVRLLPELERQGVAELLADRGVVTDDSMESIVDEEAVLLAEKS